MKQILSLFILALISCSIALTTSSEVKMSNLLSNKNLLESESSLGVEETSRLFSMFENTNKVTTSTNTNTNTNTNNKTKTQSFWKGWIKFYHYQGDPKERPHSFFVNKEFARQKVTKSDLVKKDKIGWVNIPTKFHFFCDLMENSLNILSSRNSDITKTIDSLNIDLIVPLDRTKEKSIRSIGKFKEGSCFTVDVRRPNTPSIDFIVASKVDNAQNEIWLICTDSDKVKKVLSKTLARLRFGKQQKAKKIAEKNNTVQKSTNLADTLKASVPTKKFERGKDAKDGYNVLLQDWSQCTLKCGGGYQMQQWMCVPPKKGGKPCPGKTIRKRSCNTQPCPGSKFTKMSPQKQLVKPTSKIQSVAPPIIKTAPITTRRQNYMECKISEGNVMVEQPTPGIDKPQLLPAWLVMNLNTISLFSDDTYKTAIFNLDLKGVILSSNKKNRCCFIIDAENKSYKVCAFEGCNKGLPGVSKFVRTYQYRFSLFQTKCYDGLPKADSGFSIGKLPSKKKDKDDKNTMLKHMNISVEEADTREKTVKKKVVQSEETKVQLDVKNSQDTALKVIKKEIDLEAMIKKEMQKKAKTETEELLEKMHHEEKKKEKLEQIFSEKETEEADKRKVKKAEIEVEEIKKEAVNEVSSKREALKKKIFEIKKAADRKKKVIEMQINMIRAQVAKRIMVENRKGSSEVCKKAFGKKKLIQEYCNQNVVEDLNKNIECKVMDSFCYVCCETEFGNMFIKERDQCYNMCDKQAMGHSSNEKAGGQFLWKK